MVSDMSSGLFMSAYSLGTFIGPTIGGIIFEEFNDSSYALNYCLNNNYDLNKYVKCRNIYAFVITSSIMSGWTLIILVLYMTCGKGYQGFTNLCYKSSMLATKKI